MKVLNLVDISNSDIEYKKIQFPDGQQQIVINPLSIDLFASNNKNHIVEVRSRLNNFQDLELIICATKSLRNLGVKQIHLCTPYFLGSRSDRQFENESNNYLKDVICPIINSLQFESVTVLDPHSDVLEACLNNFKKISNYQLVSFALDNLYPKSYSQKEYILVSPDAGASKKIYKLAEQIGYKGDIITCSKDRDENGKLTKTVVPLNGEDVQNDIIIIDDICDGGATFINIAKEIKAKIKSMQQHDENSELTYGKIYFIVTHGIFSKGFEEISKYFDGIYCTNSYKSFSNGIVHDGSLVKQLNVF